ncbi:(2,3-dihydroxybenzoyl)adenylate synthase [Amycolatopsis sp. lyj-90]|uniref:(2,3-dihydroxybenzoyl)adenylate synthase n=1 Tax=Amycolatopsis sp. lyj-90 TaxID=2789285 RepID=UPI003979F1B6
MLEGCVPRADEEIARLRETGYWAGRTLGRLLRERSRTYGARTALVDHDRRFSYAELDDWADRLAAGFAKQGIGRHDRILVQLPNSAEFVAVCFALFRLGALPVFTLPAYRADEVRHLCDIAQAVAYIVPDEFGGYDYRRLARQVVESRPELKNVFVDGDPGEFTALSGLAPSEVDSTAPDLPDPDPSDVAFFLLSGGTTALPKLIPRTHDDYLYQARITAEIDRLDVGTVYLAVLPVEFNFTWGCPGIIGTLHAGGTVVLSASPSPDECFELIERERVTLTSVVPTVLHLWLEGRQWSGHDLSSLQVVQVGSAKLHREVAEEVEPAFGCRLQQVFGMAEGLLTFTRFDDPPETIVGTQGRPVSEADEVRVVDSAGRDVGPGEIGELLARGPYTLRGYFRAPEHNAVAFTEDGFYHSGDLVRLTEDGNMVVEGRIKDVIIRGGDKVSATEVEAHLTAHEEVEQAAVVPVPDSLLGERTCAYLIVTPGRTAPALAVLKEFLRRRGLADFKLPDEIEVVTEFPLTGLGKVDKKALARVAARRPAETW